MRLCSICKIPKIETEFRWRNHDNSYHYCCKDCEREKNKIYMRNRRAKN